MHFKTLHNMNTQLASHIPIQAPPVISHIFLRILRRGKNNCFTRRLSDPWRLTWTLLKAHLPPPRGVIENVATLGPQHREEDGAVHHFQHLASWFLWNWAPLKRALGKKATFLLVDFQGKPCPKRGKQGGAGATGLQWLESEGFQLWDFREKTSQMSHGPDSESVGLGYLWNTKSLTASRILPRA